MPDEDPIEFPDEWLAALRPRRTGRRGWHYQVTGELGAALAEARTAYADEIEEMLANPLSDPRLAQLARSGARTVEAVGVRLTVEMHVMWQNSFVALADECVQLLGLPAAAAACVESAVASVVYGHQCEPRGQGKALVATDMPVVQEHDQYGRFAVREELLDHVRRLLSVADESTWQAAVDRLRPYRTGTWAQRLATSHLVPDRRDWVSSDIAELPADYPWWARSRLLAYCAFESSQLAGFVANELGELVTVIDAIGHEATPLLLRSLQWWYVDRESRTRILDVLAQIPSTEALVGLLTRAAMADVPEAFAAAAARQPERALRVLIERRDDPFAPALLAQHIKTFPDLADRPAPVERRPRAPIASIPTVLTSPPWARPKPKPVAVPVPDIGLHIRWLDGEREQWSWDHWPTFEETHYDSALAERPGSARFYLGGSPAAVQPKLATWRAEESSFYLENPRLLVGKYELDAYPPTLRLARAKPAVGADLLLPYLSADVVRLMAKWLASSRQFRRLALEWFARHGPEAVMPLLPSALGRPSADGRVAALALTRLDPELVRTAGHKLGCAEHVEALLARDPLDLLPAKVPGVPTWLDLDLLPDVVTRDGRYALDAAGVNTLCRVIGMSQIDDPYAGLAVIAEAFDPTSLAAFAWTLFAFWHIEGRPAKDAWAMDALGYFGDATVAERLAERVRRWPSEGSAQRAKRGADLLALIDSPSALRQLSSIARSAKSTPLRKHAAAALDRVAADRGLLPEQLDDLLAPDLGLGDDVVEYRGVAYKADVGARLDLVLRDQTGTTIVTLPKPSTDAEKATASQWNKRRRTAKGEIADQARRLEEAMIVQRLWAAEEFALSIAAHPLLGRLAQRLVWTADDRLAAVDPLGDLVDLDGGLLGDVEWIQIAHPASSDLEPWRGWMAQRALTQPFEQLDRTTYDGDPSQHWNAVVSAASLYALARRGWHWGATGRAATRAALLRPFGPAGSVVLHIKPGVSAVQDPVGQPDQTIEEISLQSPMHDDLAVFSDLPRVTRSELLRDLALLERRNPPE